MADPNHLRYRRRVKQTSLAVDGSCSGTKGRVRHPANGDTGVPVYVFRANQAELFVTPTIERSTKIRVYKLKSPCSELQCRTYEAKHRFGIRLRGNYPGPCCSIERIPTERSGQTLQSSSLTISSVTSVVFRAKLWVR